jgi:hypothetical protein
MTDGPSTSTGWPTTAAAPTASTVPADPTTAAAPPVEAAPVEDETPSFDIGSIVEFQTTDNHTGQAVRGVGIVRGHQIGEEGTLRADANGNQYRVGFVKPGLIVTPLSSDTFVLDDDEIL